MVKAGGQPTASDNGRNDNDTDPHDWSPVHWRHGLPVFEVEVVERPCQLTARLSKSESIKKILISR
jgi:hypothetical protein